MIDVEFDTIKCFENFTGSSVSAYQGSISLEANEKVEVSRIQEGQIYVKKNGGEGWVPAEYLKLTRQRLEIEDVSVFDLRVIIRVGLRDKESRLTYTNRRSAVVGETVKVNCGQKIKIGIMSFTEVIGSVTIDPWDILSSYEDSHVTHELEIYLNSHKINYFVLSLNISKEGERQELFSRTTKVQNRSNVIERLVHTCKATVVYNEISINGVLNLTSFYFSIVSETISNQEVFTIWIPSIRSLKLTPKSLQIQTKDLRLFEITTDDIRFLHDSINNFLTSQETLALDYFKLLNYEYSYESKSRACAVFSEFQRFGSPSFIISYLNLDYSVCPSYPCILINPGNVSDQVLRKVAEFRSKGRIPTVTWCRSNVALYRSSQPKLGLGKRSQDDENFFTMAKIKYVIDARPGMNAKANRLKGKGYERECDYGIKIKFMNIQNIHHVTRSFEALLGIGSKKEDFWYALSESKWMNHVGLILKASVCCSNHLVLEKASILVHCSDGWDRTSQICALTQLLIDPFYRTIEGFIRLIEKDWFGFGHKFFDRTFGHEYSPIFLLFLDCVHQIMDQFPEDFEYNQAFLLYLADSSIRGICGEFLVNCERERLDMILRTQTVWKKISPDWKNKSYCPGFYCILPVSTSSHRFRVWPFFTRYS